MMPLGLITHHPFARRRPIMIMIPRSSSRPRDSLSGSGPGITGTLIMIGITTAIVAVIIAGVITAVEIIAAEIIAAETTMAATIGAAIPMATTIDKREA